MAILHSAKIFLIYLINAIIYKNTLILSYNNNIFFENMNIKLLLIITLIGNCACFSATLLNTPLYRYWNCIGFKHCFVDNKPYQFNVGEIPLIAWKTENNTYLSTLNFCKHFGSTLNEGKIEDGCLECPYHGYKHSENDKCGVIVEHDNKLWWSYNPVEKVPQTIPYIGEDFVSDYIEYEMNENLPFCMYNSMDINHAQHIHSGIFGFGSDIPVKNYKHIKKAENIIGTSFDHYLKGNIKLMNKNVSLGTEAFASNYHEYIYPSTTWSVVSHDEYKKLVIGFSMTPVDTYKTKWYVTIRSNYMKEGINKNILNLAARMILSQDKKQFERQSKNTLLRDSFILTNMLNNEDHILDMKKIFKNYEYPKLKDFIDYHISNS